MKDLQSFLSEYFKNLKKPPHKNLKKSPHFDAPLSEDRKKEYQNFLSDPQKIAGYQFLPMIGYTIVERRYSKVARKKKQPATPALDTENPIKKERPIRYVSNYARMIYSWYSKILSEKYEDRLQRCGLDDNILAYRSAPKHARNLGVQWNNIFMAKEVFDEIHRRGNNCYVYAYDIESFFDHIDHKLLKERWGAVLGLGAQEKLPEDHYNIYKSLTKYVYIEKYDLFRFFKKDLNTRVILKNSSGKKRKGTFKLSKKGYQYNRNLTEIKFRQIMNKYKAGAQFREFRTQFKQRGFELVIHPHKYGIPQGTPISALLSNIYMLDFDKQMKTLCKEHNLFYRRYSDDILIISDKNDNIKNIIRDFVEKTSKSILGKDLDIYPLEGGKSQFYDCICKKHPIQYLGFSYDGSGVSLRQSGISRYYRKELFWIRSSTGALIRNRTIIGNSIYREKIDELYSFPSSSKRGNYLTYVDRAREVFAGSNYSSKIRVFKRHKKVLERRIQGANRVLRAYQSISVGDPYAQLYIEVK